MHWRVGPLLSLWRVPYVVLAAWAAFMIAVVADGRWKMFRFFMSVDDAFFYLTIARNIARGLGSTFDQLSPTNGYQPLWLGLLAAAYRVTGPLSPEAGIAVAVALGGGCALGGGVLLVRLLTRLGAAPAVVVLGVLGLLANVGFWFFGMETHLGVLTAAVFFTAMWSRWTGAGAREYAGRGNAVLLAFAAALLVFTRLDLVLWVAVCFPVLAIGRLATGWPRVLVRRLFVIEAGVSAAVVVGYLVFNRVTFGLWMPISVYLRTQPLSFYGLEWLLSPEGWTDLIQMIILLVTALVMLAWAARVAHRRGARVLAGTPAGFGALLAFCVLAHSACSVLLSVSFEPRYHVMSAYAILLVAAILMNESRSGLALRLQTMCNRLTLAASLAMALFLMHVGMTRIQASADQPSDLGQFGAAMAGIVPHGSVVFQVDWAGETAWFCDCRLINGDGLVNSWAFQRAVRERRVVDYLRESGTEFVVYSDGPADADGRLWLRGWDWAGDSPFPIVALRQEDALLRVGAYWLFRFPR